MAVSPDLEISRPAPGWELLQFSASADFASWKQLLTEMERSVHQVFAFGFTDEELLTAKSVSAAGPRRSVQKAPRTGRKPSSKA